MISKNASRQEGERSCGKSDYNIYTQAERLLSDNTSAHFKPRHDGGKARRGDEGGIVQHYCRVHAQQNLPLLTRDSVVTRLGTRRATPVP